MAWKQCVVAVTLALLHPNQCAADDASDAPRIAFGVAGHSNLDVDNTGTNAALQPNASTTGLEELFEPVDHNDSSVEVASPTTYTPLPTEVEADAGGSTAPELLGETAALPGISHAPVEAIEKTHDRDSTSTSPSPVEELATSSLENAENSVSDFKPRNESTNTIEFDALPQSAGSDADASVEVSLPSTSPPSTPPNIAPEATSPPPLPTNASSHRPPVNVTTTAMAPVPSSGVNTTAITSESVRNATNSSTRSPDPRSESPGVVITTEASIGVDGKSPGGGRSSMSGEPHVGDRPPRRKKTPSGDPNDSTGTGESTNQSGTSLYSMGTASIMSIVGVIVGICVIVSLFIVISRRKYGEEEDDDVLGYGGGAKIDNGQPVVRLSPTFLMNDMAAPVPGKPFEPEYGSLSPRSIMASNRSARIASGAVACESPTIMMAAPPSTSRQSSFSEGGPSPSAFESATTDLSAVDGRSSAGWSSVLESDYRSASRCTRDTTLSSMTMSQNFSEFNPSEISRHTLRSTQSGFESAGFYRVTRSSAVSPAAPPPQGALLFDYDTDDMSSQSFDFSSRSPAERSTDGSLDLSQYVSGSHREM